MEQPDKDILDFIAAETGNAVLAQQIASAQVRKRDYTRTGLFLYFELNLEVEAVPAGLRPASARIDSPDLMDGAGCDLFLRDGRLHYLEVYSRGGFLPEALSDYRLISDD